MSKDNCTDFVWGDGAEWDDDDPDSYCKCPECGGNLPREFPLSLQFKCGTCGVVLETIPNMQIATEDGMIEDLKEDIEEGDWDQDEIDEVVYESYGGRICLVPDYAVKKDD